jgi:hypothetical protein
MTAANGFDASLPSLSGANQMNQSGKMKLAELKELGERIGLLRLRPSHLAIRIFGEAEEEEEEQWHPRKRSREVVETTKTFWTKMKKSQLRMARLQPDLQLQLHRQPQLPQLHPHRQPKTTPKATHQPSHPQQPCKLAPAPNAATKPSPLKETNCSPR